MATAQSGDKSLDLLLLHVHTDRITLMASDTMSKTTTITTRTQAIISLGLNPQQCCICLLLDKARVLWDSSLVNSNDPISQKHSLSSPCPLLSWKCSPSAVAIGGMVSSMILLVLVVVVGSVC